MSLSKRINLIVLIGLIFTFLISIVLNYVILNRIIKNRFLQKIYLIGNELSRTSKIALLLHDKEIIKMRTKWYENDRDIKGIIFYDKMGKIFYKQGKFSGKFIDFDIKVTFSDSPKTLGKVRIWYSESFYKIQLIKIFSVILIILSVGFIIIAFIISKLIRKSVINPVNNLIKFVKQIENGNFNLNLNAENVGEISILANAFKNMAVSLEKKNRELKKSYEIMAEHKTLAELGKFGMMVAHEIKNPLGIIKGATQVLKKDEVSQEVKEEMINFIEDEVKRLDTLVREFMAISKTKNPELKKIDIKEFFENLVEKINLLSPDVNIITEFKCEKKYKWTDPELLTQIITNLIKNSIEAEATTINLFCYEQNNSWIIEISDNGIGINENEIEKIFEPFYTKKDKGTGLGLVIVNNYVKLLNGKISVKSKKGKGTEFKLIFPEGS